MSTSPFAHVRAVVVFLALIVSILVTMLLGLLPSLFTRRRPIGAR